MAAGLDLYAILGVARDATADDIKRAYRSRAREFHPDASGDPATEERFKEVSAAYEILSDPAKRERYDRFGDAGGPGSAAPFSDIADLFDAFFGGGGFGTRTRAQRRTRTQRGEDLFVRITLSFEEAAFGAHREIAVERFAACDGCDGSGARPGTSTSRCGGCSGTGHVQEVRRGIFGTVMTSAPCGRCEATGEEIVDRCSTCGGRGRAAAAATVPVDIPAGVSDGLEVRVAGAGHAGRAGGAAGDLYLSLAVAPHPSFERRGQDLFATLDVPFTVAALGGRTAIDTLDGDADVEIPAGTQHGDVIRVKDAGVPNLGRRGRGDLFLSVAIEVPRRVRGEERDLLERLTHLRGDAAPRLRRTDG